MLSSSNRCAPFDASTPMTRSSSLQESTDSLSGLASAITLASATAPIAPKIAHNRTHTVDVGSMAASIAPSPTKKGLRILIVDDNHINLASEQADLF